MSNPFDTTPAEAPTTPTVPVDEKFFGQGYQPPPLPANATLEQRMYRTPTGLLPALKAHHDTMRDTLGFTQAEVERFSRDHAEALQEADLPASVFGPDMVAAGMQARLAERSGVEPDNGRMLAEATNIRREYRVMLGSERAERLFNTEIPSFLTAHPRLLKLVQQPGFGETPAAEGFMRKLAEHVRRVWNV